MPTSAWNPERLVERQTSNKHPSDVPLVWIALSVAFGFSLGSFVGLTYNSILGCLLLSVLLLVAWSITWRKGWSKSSSALLIGVVGCLAIFWNGTNQKIYSTNDLSRYAQRDAIPVCVEAVVSKAPRFYPAEPSSPFHAIPPTDQSVVMLKLNRFRNGTTWEEIQGECSARIAGKSELQVGQTIQLFGQLRLPNKPSNPGERDASGMSRARRVTTIIWSESAECAEVISEPKQHYSNCLNQLAMIRQSVRQSFQQQFREDVQPLASAMLLGDSSKLSYSISERYRKSGALHVLVVSGLHVGLIAGLPLLLCRIGLATIRTGKIASVLSVIAYVLLVGAHPPALRASIVAIAAIAASSFDRRSLGINSLAAAAICLFVLSPGAFHSAGTRLSFFAAATLLGVASWVSHRNKRPLQSIDRLVLQYENKVWKLSKKLWRYAGLLVLASAAVMTTTGPFIAAEFHLVSPSAIVLALPLMALVSIAIPVGLLATALQIVNGLIPSELIQSLFDFPISLLFSLCGHAIRLLDWLVSLAGESSFGSFYTSGPADWWVLVWYLFLPIGISLFHYAPTHRRLIIHGGMLIVAIGFSPLLFRAVMPSNTLQIHTIAVGHGSSLLLQLPDGKNLLYDAGGLGSPRRSAEIISAVLWDKGIEHIDAVILSHADVDHYNALPEMLKRFNIREVWTTRVMFDSWDLDSPQTGPKLLRKLLSELEVPIREIALGDIVNLEDVKIEVLHPTKMGVIGSDNANSLVLGIEHQDFHAVLTGDVEEEGLEQLLSSESYPCDLLIAPHHGSRRSNPPGLIAWCKPKWVVISSGHDHPNTQSDYSAAGAKVLNTHNSGLISVSVTRQQATISHFCQYR